MHHAFQWHLKERVDSKNKRESEVEIINLFNFFITVQIILGPHGFWCFASGWSHREEDYVPSSTGCQEGTSTYCAASPSFN